MNITHVIPMLAFQDANAAINFYKNAFEAIEVLKMEENGKIVHAEMKIGSLEIMIADEVPAIDVKSPATVGACPMILMLVTNDVDEVFNKAVASGARIDRAVEDHLDGRIRNGKLIDPFGYKWMISNRLL